MSTMVDETTAVQPERWLQGKSALVTGGSRGIGRGITRKLAELGARVAIGYLQDDSAAADALHNVRELGSDGFVMRADISHPDQVQRLMERVREEFGTLDILVSNARGDLSTFCQPPLKLSLDCWDLAINTQAKAFLVAVQAAAPILNPGARIVAITYTAGARSGSWQPWLAMGAAKAALESLVRYFAVALGPRGITVNALSPGFTDDTVLNTLPAAAVEMVRRWHESGWTPMRRLGTPADIGNMVTLLCRPEAGWMTGQTIFVDGGASVMDAGLPLELQLAG